MTFINIAKPENSNRQHDSDRIGRYGYDQPSAYLRVWSRLFQDVVSQACTRMLTGAFHDRDCAIMDATGGVNVWRKRTGNGDREYFNNEELILGERSCYWGTIDSSIDEDTRNNWVKRCGSVVTAVVLNFDPMDPAKSIVEAAAEDASAGALEPAWEFAPEDLTQALKRSEPLGPYGGNPLWAFWQRITNTTPEATFWREMRPYLRFVKTKHLGLSDVDVDREFADIDQANELEEKLREKFRKRGHFLNSCYAKRFPSSEGKEDAVRFWVTATSSDLHGWVSRDEIERFLAS